MRTIDINADLGEGGAFDAELFPLISSVNIACGVHAGDWTTMDASVRLAMDHGVAIGAHPSLPDRDNFGRAENGWIGFSGNDVHNAIIYQVGAMAAFCRVHRMPLKYVKAHGSLYNQAMAEPAVAKIVSSALAAFDTSLPVFAQSGSVLEHVAKVYRLTVIHEAFADRAYNADGSLVSRSLPGAVLHDPEMIADRMERLVTTGEIETIDGGTISLLADTICIHSDTEGAVQIAKTLRARFDALGIAVRSAV